MIVTFSQHHSQGTEAEEVLHEMANNPYQYGPNVHHVHQVRFENMSVGNYLSFIDCENCLFVAIMATVCGW